MGPKSLVDGVSFLGDVSIHKVLKKGKTNKNGKRRTSEEATKKSSKKFQQG
jgi:hypothetical protein